MWRLRDVVALVEGDTRCSEDCRAGVRVTGCSGDAGKSGGGGAGGNECCRAGVRVTGCSGDAGKSGGGGAGGNEGCRAGVRVTGCSGDVDTSVEGDAGKYFISGLHEMVFRSMTLVERKGKRKHHLVYASNAVRAPEAQFRRRT